MATLYGSGKGLVRLIAGLQIMIGILFFVFGIVCTTLLCHWTSTAGLGIWVGIIVVATAGIGLYSCSVSGQQMITWYSWASIFCALLSIMICISYGTSMSDFYDELNSNANPVDDFYSRRYVAVYMRTYYYEHCVSDKRKAEIEKERTGYSDIVVIELDEENNLLIEMTLHGRKGLGLSAVIMFLGAIEFVFACFSVMYSCTAAGWFIKKPEDTPARSSHTIHHSQASQVLLR
ncbi:uncharacterized protein LOC114535659 [Dendronephthya gigantea]|uniref:uncharacterized protein LOC114535659 n=1 Tax=Dendronephthya gigantea TaxID=151771 RepID=UPI00106AE73A|nr:uncharacterized protein LOC114535659 [Dendronephthya gigantea]